MQEVLKYEQTIYRECALIVEEQQLVDFFQWLRKNFSNVEFEIRFSDKVSIKHSDPELLFKEVARQAELVALAAARCWTYEEKSGRIVESVRIEVGESGERTIWITIELDGSGHKFYAIKDRVGTFVANCVSWYNWIYSRSLLQKILIWLCVMLLLMALIAKLALLLMTKAVGIDLLVDKLSSPLYLSSALTLLMALSVASVSVLEKWFMALFPKTCLVIGSAKRRYERVAEVRKWVLGAMGGAIVGALWIILRA